MKTTQILYILLFIGIVVWILTSTHLLDTISEGFQDASASNKSEPIIPKGIEPTRLPVQAMPNEANPGPLLYAPYGQTASVGSFPYQDPSLAPAELSQMKRINEDVKSFLVFEGANAASSSDPTVQLPLTQLRADSRKLSQEVSVLEKNPGIPSSMTQQDLADIEGALAFLQRKVRLFQTSGVISDSKEGFESGSSARASKADLLEFQTKIYAAIQVLSASGTTDTITTTRISKLQDMYAKITTMVTRIESGIIEESDIPVFKDDIADLLPKLGKTSQDINDIFSSSKNDDSESGSGGSSGAIGEYLSGLLGEKNVSKAVKGFLRNGSLKLSFDLGYNLPGTKKDKKDSNVVYSRKLSLQNDGTMGYDNSSTLTGSPLTETVATTSSMDSAYDTSSPGMDDRANSKTSGQGLDWKNRATSICEQVRLRGLDPLDFGCIAEGSTMSPAYSWRGHTKMICGRLTATTDPDLPRVSGCPPADWKGWTLSY